MRAATMISFRETPSGADELVAQECCRSGAGMDLALMGQGREVRAESVVSTPSGSSFEPKPTGPSQRNVTQLLEAAGDGDSAASEALLPLVYDELRRIAASQLSREPAGQTLQPTAL